MFRFRLRTLLIATAVIGLFMAFQVHVHMKARRFVEAMKESPRAKRGVPDDYQSFASAEDYKSFAQISPVTLADVFLLRRRCHVFIGTSKSNGIFNNAYEVYLINCFGDMEVQDQAIWYPRKTE